MTSLSSRARILGAIGIAFACGLVFAAGINITPGTFAQSRTPAPIIQSVKSLAETGSAFVSIAEHVTPAVVSIDAQSDARAAAVDPQAPRAQRGQRGQPPGVQPLPQGLDELFGLQPDTRPTEASGSGFIVSKDGYILTNNHVVTRNDRKTLADRVVVRLNDGRSFPAKVVGHDPETDVAVLKIDGNDFPTAVLGDDNASQVGEWVVAIGNPLGFLDFTVTAGIVSAKGRQPPGINQEKFGVSDFIQTDAAINPGNSGGPLVNIKGEVIGINSAIASQTGFYSGYGFAIPITLAHDVMNDLIKYGHLRAGMLGVQIGEVTDRDAGAAGLKAVKGVLVEAFPDGPESPAKNAGILPGDVIVQADGKPVDRVSQLQRMVRTHEPGETIVLDVMRFGTQKTFRVRVADRGDASAETALGRNPTPPASSKVSYDKLGIAVQVYTGQTDRLTGRGSSPDVRGLLVTDISTQGPANGLLFESDVLVQVLGPGAQKDIRTEDDLRGVLSKLGSGDFVSLWVRSVDPRAASQPYRVVTLKMPK
jgi:serine protease Do